MPRHAGGRPSKLDPQRMKRFVDAIRGGSYVEVAATYAGIGTSTVYRWMAIGREATSGQYREFWQAVKEAEAAAELSAVMRVQAAASQPQHWTAAMTFLERRFRDRWGRPAAVAPGASPADAAPLDSGEATSEPIIVPLQDRVAGLLRELDRAGKLDLDDSGHADGNGAAVAGSVSANGGEPDAGATG